MSFSSRTQMFKPTTTDETIELDYYNNLFIDMDLPDVEEIIIDSVFQGRPDRIAYKKYGDFNLGWLICWHNDILDPVNELVVGKKIRIPDIREFYRYLNKNKFSRQRRRR